MASRASLILTTVPAPWSGAASSGGVAQAATSSTATMMNQGWGFMANLLCKNDYHTPSRS